MATDQENNKSYECPFCHKSMNRKFSFERHKKQCVDRLQGGKNFVPYQCPSPKMAQKSAGAFIDNFLPRLSGLYNRNRTSYHEVEDLDNNNYHSTNHQTREGSRIWGGLVESIRNIKFLNSHAQRKNGFLPISSEVAGSELGVVRVAVVGLGQGKNMANLHNWYSQPDEGEWPGSSELSPVPHLHLPAQCPEKDQD